jgi:hypothetical protein
MNRVTEVYDFLRDKLGGDRINRSDLAVIFSEIVNANPELSIEGLCESIYNKSIDENDEFVLMRNGKIVLLAANEDIAKVTALAIGLTYRKATDEDLERWCNGDF